MSPDGATPNPLARQAGGFLIVGSLGFLVDAGIFLALSHSGAVGLLTARLLAFLPATLVTWVLNRRAVFRSERQGGPIGQRQALHEYLRYLLIQGLGIAINFTIFYLTVQAAPGASPLLALVLGSGAALVFNFLGAKLLVFKR